ncbi:TOL-like protein [Colletotrichum higginsianum]|nr:TOL-like protein [Colletotrichum higginsianum]
MDVKTCTANGTEKSEMVPSHSCRHCQRFTIYLYDEFSSTATLRPGDAVYKQVAPNPSQVRVIQQGASHQPHSVSRLRSYLESDLSGCSFFEASLEDMRIYADDGCKLARHFMQRLAQPVDPSQPKLAWARDALPVKYALGVKRLLPDCMEFGYIDMARMKWHDLNGFANLQLARHLPSAYTPIALRQDPASQVVDKYPISRDAASPGTIARVRERLLECLEGHGECAKPRWDYTPTRLVELAQEGSDDGFCRLREMGSCVLPYCALSYCWGGDQTFKTTSKTLHGYYKQLPRELPQTLLDAMLVTRRLGFRHLWVDALCIIQDSDADRAREIGRMARVYSNATVTIAATRATAVRDGFLGPRPTLVDEAAAGHAYTLPAQMANGEVGEVTLIPTRGADECEPLDERGWCFQERLLSPRVLDFLTLRTVFSCREAAVSDGWSDGAPDSAYGEALDMSSLDMARLFAGSTGGGGGGGGQDLEDAWLKVVTAFAGRQLTYFADKLPAVAGLAESFGGLMADDDEYCAGLWLRSMPASLLWKGSKTAAPDLRSDAAPSWSWASVPGPVWSLPPADMDAGMDMDATAGGYAADLIDPRVPYGPVRNARLTMTAHVRRAQWLRAGWTGDFFVSHVLLLSDEPPSTSPVHGQCGGTSAASENGHVGHDAGMLHFEPDATGEWAVEALAAATDVQLVYFGTISVDGRPRLVGLVVMASEGCGHVFVRIGTFYCDNNRHMPRVRAWFVAAKRESIILG